MLSHERHAHQTQNCNPKQCKEDGMKRIHERLDDSLIPPIREVSELRNVVTNAGNFFCCIWVVPKPFP